MDKINKDQRPPKWALNLLKWYCRGDRFEELSGDLEEIYDLRFDQKRKWKSDLNYIWSVLRCWKAYSRKSNFMMDTSGALLQSFFKLTFRHMFKNKWTMVINIVGLGFALAFSVMSYMIHGYNEEFDSIYSDESLHRVHAIRNDAEMDRWEFTPLALEDALKADHSATEEVTSYIAVEISLKKGKYYFPNAVAFASPSWTEMFNLPLKYGSKSHFPKHGIFLTEEASSKMFGEKNPVGEFIGIYYFGRKMPEVEILGVFERIPANSSFNFEALANIETLVDLFEMDRSDWSMELGLQFGQYVKLSSPDKRRAVETHLQTYVPVNNDINETWKIEKLELVQFRDPIINYGKMHSYGRLRMEESEIYIVYIMAALILFIACFNLANTNIALLSKRIKEIGIRKTVGSSSSQIFGQFILETGIIMTLAFLFALSVTNFLSVEVLDLYGSDFQLQDLDKGGIALFIALFLTVVSLITGLIPALNAKKFQPVTIINHKSKLKDKGPVHGILAVLQYSLSIAVLIAGITFMKNTSFLKEQDFGYDPENLMVIRVKDGEEYKEFEALLQNQKFSKEIFGSYQYLSGYNLHRNFTLEGVEVQMDECKVVGQFLTKMGVQFHSGRDFLEGGQQDIEEHIIINKQYADRFLKGDPIGQQIQLDDGQREVIGVIENYINAEPFADYVDLPIIFTPTGAEQKDHLFIRTYGEPDHEVLTSVEEIWNENMDRPMVWGWQHEKVYSYVVDYAEDLKRSFIYLSGIALILSLISIISIVSLHVNRRKKELSIRKVLGANLMQIFQYINRPFGIILGISLLLGTGLGILISDYTLSSIYLFYRSIHVLEAVGIGILVVITGLIVLNTTIFRPVKESPVAGLRTE